MIEDRQHEYFIHTQAGYCYYSIGNNPIIFNLYVNPEYRRRGNAKKLLQYVINEIRQTGYQGNINIEAKPREDSISMKDIVLFYEKLGLSVSKDNQS